jgi:Fe-S cluster assembly protein SufD
MSPNVFVDSRPFLEILANDVRCTHGSTTGKLDEEQLYYLENRGIDYNRAEELLIEGFVGDVFDRMKNVGVTNVIPHLMRNLFK